MATVLTSTQTADLLDVHPSTVKRWCDGGDLSFESTEGGHRRITIDAAQAFARSRGIRTILSPFRPFEGQVWNALRSIESESFEPVHRLGVEWARRGDYERLEQLYLTLGRTDLLPFTAFLDHAVQGLMHTVGAEWEAGRMRVGVEHMVTEAMTGALLTLRREWLDHDVRGSTAPPVAVVGAMEGNRHTLGSLCVRLTLERAGWSVLFPGGDVPIEDFGLIQRGREASLVCISLPPGAVAGDVSRCVEILSRYYDRARPYDLMFGGGGVGGPHGPFGAPPGAGLPFESVRFLHDCGSLVAAVVGDDRSASGASR